MRPDKFTAKLQDALADAQSLAVGRDHNYIEPIHLLIALYEQQNGSIKPLLQQVGADASRLQTGMQQALEKLPRIQNPDGNILWSKDSGRLLNLCDKLAQKRGDQFIASELLILALVDDKCEAGKLLREVGVTKAAVERAIQQMRGGENVMDANAESNRQSLDKYCINLTERAESGKLDHVIGRDEEIRRTIQVLQRRTKNNPG